LQRVDHLLKHDVVGVGARAARRLDDDRRINRGRSVHDRESLLHIVDVECGNAVAMLGCVIEQLPQGYSSHQYLLQMLDVLRIATPGRSRPSSYSKNAPPAVETAVDEDAHGH